VRIHVISRHVCVAPKLVQISTVAWIAASFPIKFKADLRAEFCEMSPLGHHPVMRPELAAEDFAVSLHDE
jgi:hypothetical protein